MEIQETRDADAQRILDSLNGKMPEGNTEDNVELPSDNYVSDVQNNEEPDEKLFAGKYKSVDELKKGIKSIGSTLPDYIVEGMNEEALEKHYLELQSEFSSGKRKYEDAPKEENKEPVDDGKPKAVSAELWAELSETFNTTGKITSEQYDKLEAVGIPSEIVDNYIDGLASKAQQTAREIYNIAGGEESFLAMKEWAENNIDATYINSIGKMPYPQMIQAIKGIKAQYDLEHGSTGRRIVGEVGSSKTGSYRSRDEYLADVKDKRYGKDKLFMKAVEEKLKRSKNIF